LIAILINKESEKGAVLTEEEVKNIRDNSGCMTMTFEQSQKLVESRGYDNIDPENAYSEYLQVREGMK
jgi:hypothetical protein